MSTQSKYEIACNLQQEIAEKMNDRAILSADIKALSDELRSMMLADAKQMELGEDTGEAIDIRKAGRR